MEQKKTVLDTVRYIERYLDTELTLSALEKEMNYSKFYLNRLFAAQAGKTIYKYIQLRRLTNAADKLVHTQEMITDIAYGCGYQSQQAFTQAFRHFYDCTPAAYRKKGIFTPLQVSLLPPAERSRTGETCSKAGSLYRSTVSVSPACIVLYAGIERSVAA